MIETDVTREEPTMETAPIARRAGDRAGAQAVALRDRYLPEFDVTSSFHKPLDVPAADVLAALARLRPLDRVAAGLVALGFADRLVSPPLVRSADGAAGALGRLAVDPDHGVAFGLVWRIDETAAPAPAPFERFDEPGCVKVVWTLTVRPDGDGRSLLSSEVRVRALDAVTSRRVRDGWSVAGPLVEAQARRMLATAVAAVEADEEDEWVPRGGTAGRLWLRAAGM
jgi:hypothetical protein